jgi:transcriptional regulator with XRE-family HTH domain
MARPTVTTLIRQRINHLLYKDGRSQAEFATYLGVSQPAVSMMLSGERGIDLDKLDRMARFFGISVAELFMIDGEKFRERRSGHDRRRTSDRRKRSERRSGQDRRRDDQ